MIVRLLVSNDKTNVKKVVLRSDTVIGRSSECNLRIASREVSRKHCSILLTEPFVRVRDLGSANGTVVNGTLIDPNVDVPVASGSNLEIGNVRFVVQYDTPYGETDEPSTAEVPNAVLNARLAADASAETPDATTKQPPPLTEQQLPAAGMAAESAMETSRSNPDETIHVARNDDRGSVFDPPDDSATQQATEEAADQPVDDDTFALKESEGPHAEEEEEANSPANVAGVDETMSMSREEFLPQTRQADAEEPRALSEPAVKSEPTKNKGWKSLFGMLRGKQAPVVEKSADADVPVHDESAPPREQGTDETLEFALPDSKPHDPEAGRKTVPEFDPVTGEEVTDGSAENQKTVSEFAPVEDQSSAETVNRAADESLSEQPPLLKPPETSAADSNLQDFFRQMSNE